MSNALTTKARVKERLTISTTDFDDLFDNLIVAVTARIETMTGRSFTLATYTEEIHDGGDVFGSNRTILITRNAPVNSVTSIEYKAGSNTTPNWTTFDENDYDIDYESGLIYFSSPLPSGKRNIRITYNAGWEGFDELNSSLWSLNTVPTGTVDGSNAAFTLAADAEEIIVYADGVRVLTTDVTHTAGTDTFTLAANAVPYSTIAVDYKASTASADGTAALPMELVDLCERVVVFLFKKRDSEGKSTEAFSESSITWRSNMFTADMLATIKNYRRGYDI